MEKIELNFQYTEADFKEFLRDYMFRNRFKWWVIMAVWVLLLLAYLNRDEEFLSAAYLLKVVLPVVFLLGLWWWILNTSSKKTFKMNPQLQEGRNCTIDAEGINIQGHTFSSDFKWAGVQRVVETDKLILLYNSKVSAIMLPKRAFDPQQLALFREIVGRQPNLEIKWKS